ncbi:hypothetical protein GCK72_012068 [Caenorhabditis remanei]|uniref:SPK domain-containing protein n=1 Tax=Caenorhabditis remanei TaxID=31234 RepID=A0A6A5GK20_CAERE|nr:hypothetical protein GCK72_012068 [Caenorhabditis remanei]KAF1755618.1 hypothetical protein GCK72_012068 [Caenorhabditis remanei]
MTETRKPKWLGLGEENVKIMNFLVKKTKNIESPLHLNQLSCDLRDHVGSPSPADTFKKRIRKQKSKIEEEMAYSDETKVKLIFGLGASISDKYLEEIRKDAIVRVDERRRIIRYQRKDGEFELRGVHRYHDLLTRAERTEKMLEFLAEKAETAASPICHTILAREFKERNDSPENEIVWENRFNQVIPKIYRAGYVRQTRIRMMFMTSCKLTEEQLNRYQERADIEVDSEKRIIKYKANDGSCELKGDHSMGVKMRQGKEEIRRRSKLMNKLERDSSDEEEEEESDGDHMDDDEAIRIVNQMTASVKKEIETPKSRRLPDHKHQKVDETQEKVSGDSESEEEEVSEEKEDGSDSEASSDSDEENEAEKDENSDSDGDDEEETEKSVNQEKPLKTERKERTPLPKTPEVSKPTESNRAAEVVGGSREEILKSFSRGDTTKSNEKSAEAIIANIVNQRIENRVKEITEQSKARGTVVGDNSQKKMDSNGMTVKTVGEVEKENVAAKEVPSENSIKNQKTASMLKGNSQNPVVAPNSGNNESNSQGSACHADNGEEQQNPTTSKNQSETSKASVSVTTETDAISEISAEKSTESAPRESRDLMTPNIPRGDLKRKIGEEDEVDPSKRAKCGVDSGETPKENQNTMIPTSDDSSGNQISCDSMKTSISLRSVFIWMKEFVQCLYSKEFEGFLKTLEKEMNGFTDQNILISDITPFIDTFLVFAKKSTTSTTQSLNVKDFLTKLKITLYMMSSVIFADFQEKIDKMIAEIDRENMMIPTQFLLNHFNTIYLYLKHSS